MELLFVTVIGTVLGAMFHFTLPRRRTYGGLLLPAISAAATSVVWVVLLWIGLKFDGTWIWVASLGAGIIASLAVAIVLPRRRIEHDAKLLTRLSGGKA